jgi:hypothetical protein
VCGVRPGCGSPDQTNWVRDLFGEHALSPDEVPVKRHPPPSITAATSPTMKSGTTCTGHLERVHHVRRADRIVTDHHISPRDPGRAVSLARLDLRARGRVTQQWWASCSG